VPREKTVSMNINELKELLELISERDITEFELEEEGVRLKVKKNVVVPSAHEASNNHPPAVLTEVAPSSDVPRSREEAAEEEAGVNLVRSPMVGTFYRAPEPGAPPFVNEGDRVKPGHVLCIIEAMKLMNEIESEQAGEIVRIFVENGQPIQYGDKLFAIRSAG
jgi:oxaloacetate decarboxylase alpha subunit